jgi:hypothetical protein
MDHGMTFREHGRPGYDTGADLPREMGKENMTPMPLTNEEFLLTLQSSIGDAELDKRKASAKALCDAYAEVCKRLLVMSVYLDAINQQEKV